VVRSTEKGKRTAIGDGCAYWWVTVPLCAKFSTLDNQEQLFEIACLREWPNYDREEGIFLQIQFVAT